VVLFTRSALRVRDHPALLEAAAQRCEPLTCVYVDAGEEAPPAVALEALRAALRARGGDLLVRRGSAAEVLPSLCAAAVAADVFAACEPETVLAEVQEAAAAALASAGVRLHACELPVWANQPAQESNWRRHKALRGALLPPSDADAGLRFTADSGAAGEGTADLTSAAAGPLSFPSSPFELSEAGALRALRCLVGLGEDAGVRAAADAADGEREGTAHAVLFAQAAHLGLLSPRVAAAVANEALRVHLSGALADVRCVRRARAVLDAAERSAFHTALALSDRRPGSPSQPPRGGLPARWWRWRGALVPYTHAPGPPGAPAMLLAHGFGAFAEHWRGNSAPLSAHCGVWAPTLPGFGRTEKAALPYSAELWTAFLADFARTVVRKPGVVAGNSIGGFMSASLACDYPGLVTGLVLLNSAGPIRDDDGDAPDAPPAARRTLPALVVNALTAGLLFYLERSVAATLKRCYPVCPDKADAWLAGEIERAAADSGAAAVFASAFYLPPPRSLNRLVSGFGGPTLVLNGALDPLNDAAARARSLGERCTNARVQLLQAGHCPHDEVPELVNDAIRAFLADELLPAVPAQKQQQPLPALLGVALSLLLLGADAARAELCSADGSCRAVEEETSQLARRLRDSSAANRERYDQERLDRFYNKEFRINKLLRAEVLPEPCDPRDPEQRNRCLPNAGLPARPEDRIEGRGGRVFNLAGDELPEAPKVRDEDGALPAREETDG